MPPKKIGRPKAENPLTERLYLRVDDETKEMLNTCTETLKTTRSEVVRQGIKKVYDDLKKGRKRRTPEQQNTASLLGNRQKTIAA